MSREKFWFSLICYLVFLSVCFLALAQEPRVSIEPRIKIPATEKGGETRKLNIRVESTLVAVSVTVTDPLGRFVTGLEMENFRVFEDGVEQQVAYFSDEDIPVSVGLIFDVSGSMGSKLQKSRQAVAQFLKTANPEDEFFLVQFSDEPKVMVTLTRSASDIQSRLVFTQSRGRTALLDAVLLAINYAKKASNQRKALLIISDGGDNNSRYTEREIRNVIREANAQIYAIGIYESLSGGRERSTEEINGPSLLTNIAESTGGRQFPVGNLNDIPDIAGKIGVELRNQYFLYYKPSNKIRDGKYRRIRVKLVTPRGFPSLRVYYRTGYYAPSQ
jgi:VWFA-related protein